MVLDFARFIVCCAMAHATVLRISGFSPAARQMYAVPAMPMDDVHPKTDDCLHDHFRLLAEIVTKHQRGFMMNQGETPRQPLQE